MQDSKKTRRYEENPQTSIRYSLLPSLTLGALALKHITSISAVDPPATGLQTPHPIGFLVIVRSLAATVPFASLIVAVDVTDRCGFSCAVLKVAHFHLSS